MIRVCVEVREVSALFRVRVEAESISRALSIVKRHNPGRDVRVVFPIDPEGFFVGRPAKETGGNAAKDGNRMKLLPDRVR
jgi:hypothetical protein